MQRTSTSAPATLGSPVAVTWDAARRAPSAFVWRRRWRVERVVETWVIETGWWDERLRVSRHYSRVMAEGRVFDLYFDRLRKAWFLDRVLN